MRMNTVGLAMVLLTLALTGNAAPAPQETTIPGVTASIASLRQYDGVLHLGIVLHNADAREASGRQAIQYSDVILIDKQANKKRYALKDASEHYLAGPVSDWNHGGRWFPKLLPDSDTLLWVLFDAVAPGSTVTIQVPTLQPFDNVPVTEGAPPRGQEVGSSVPPLRASVLAATRSAGQLSVRLKIVNPGKSRIVSRTVAYEDVYALDPVGKRSYPLLRGADGNYIADPMADKNHGGRWFLSKVEPGTQAFVNLTFQAPPDTVRAVDVVFPWFSPFEATAIVGEGGAQQSGVAVAGKSVELERVLKDLNAAVTPQEIKVNLSADLLFDFDKADLKPEAEPSLGKVVTVLRSYPNARVSIEGHADGKGNENYNQKLSERRAAAAAQWLIQHSGISAANVQTRGWGKSKPIAANTYPNGADYPEGRAKNRRVEIVITH